MIESHIGVELEVEQGAVVERERTDIQRLDARTGRKRTAVINRDGANHAFSTGQRAAAGHRHDASASCTSGRVIGE